MHLKMNNNDQCLFTGDRHMGDGNYAVLLRIRPRKFNLILYYQYEHKLSSFIIIWIFMLSAV